MPTDVQLARESGRNTLHRVGGQRARQPVQRGLIVAIALKLDDPVFLRQRDARRHRNGLLALRPFDRQLPSPTVIFTPFGSGISFFPTLDIQFPLA